MFLVTHIFIMIAQFRSSTTTLLQSLAVSDFLLLASVFITDSVPYVCDVVEGKSHLLTRCSSYVCVIDRYWYIFVIDSQVVHVHAQVLMFCQ